MKLVEMSISKFSEILASNEPAPGGGSVAALAGMLGADLTMMVVRLSLGKKSYESLDENIKVQFLKDFETIQGIRQNLYHFVDEDTKAFSLFMDAMKLPKESDNDKLLRDEAIQKASIYALEIPLQTAEKCLGILRSQKLIGEVGNKNAVSDIGVGALLSLTGLEGAALNVKINIPGIKDEKIKTNAIKRIEKMLLEGRELKETIMEIVNKRIG